MHMSSVSDAGMYVLVAVLSTCVLGIQWEIDLTSCMIAVMKLCNVMLLQSLCNLMLRSTKSPCIHANTCYLNWFSIFWSIHPTRLCMAVNTFCCKASGRNAGWYVNSTCIVESDEQRFGEPSPPVQMIYIIQPGYNCHCLSYYLHH